MYSANIFTKVEVDVRESHPRSWVLAHFSYSKRNSDEPIVSKLLVWGEAEICLYYSIVWAQCSWVWKPYFSKHTSSSRPNTPFGLSIWGTGNFNSGWRWWFWSTSFFFVAMEFHQFPVHGRFGGWWFLCSSWTSQPISSHLKVIVGVFFQTTYRIICTDIILLEWWRFRNMQLFRYGSERPSQHV